MEAPKEIKNQQMTLKHKKYLVCQSLVNHCIWPSLYYFLNNQRSYLIKNVDLWRPERRSGMLRSVVRINGPRFNLVQIFDRGFWFAISRSRPNSPETVEILRLKSYLIYIHDFLSNFVFYLKFFIWNFRK